MAESPNQGRDDVDLALDMQRVQAAASGRAGRPASTQERVEETVEAIESAGRPAHRQLSHGATATGMAYSSDGCGHNSYTSDDDITDLVVKESYSGACGLQATVTYYPYSTGWYTWNYGICLKLVYRRTTDSSWSDWAGASKCFTTSEIMLDQANTWTPDAMDVTPGEEFYVRALMIDRSSSSDQWDTGATCAAGNAGTGWEWGSCCRHWVRHACATHAPTYPLGPDLARSAPTLAAPASRSSPRLAGTILVAVREHRLASGLCEARMRHAWGLLVAACVSLAL